MKNAVIGLIGLIAGISLTGMVHNYYPLTAVVTQVDYDNNTVTFDDGQNAWQIKGTEDWIAGDTASLLMDDKGTPEIEEDEIKQAHYSGLEINR